MLLATTRPLEGMLAGLPAGIVLVGLLLDRARQDRVQLLRRVFLPTTVIVIATVGGMAYLNLRVTGDPLRLPYQAYNKSYHMGAQFPWQEPSPVIDYRHKALSDFKRFWILQRAEIQREHFTLALLYKFLRVQHFLIGPGLLALMMIPIRRRDRWIVLPFVCSVLVVGLVMLTKGAQPHYAAPVTGLLFVLILDGLRRMGAIHTSRAYGPTLATLILLAYLPSFAIRSSGFVPEMRAFSKERKRVLDSLQLKEGQDLVIVRYGENHGFHMEWVYNRAVIDSAAVVWAREMSPEENRELIHYFEGRRVWLLEVNGSTRLRPFLEGPS